MTPRAVAGAAGLALLSAAALAQPYPGAASPPIAAEPLPPPAAAAGEPAPAAPPPQPSDAGAAEPAAAPAAMSGERVFCDQPVGIRVADPDSVPQRYRKFLGIWSDAAWTPAQCAALVVANVTADGTASILYVFGPLGGNAKAPHGILRGTGIIRDGELRFQNSDGSQFAFRPLYADLEGHLTAPNGSRFQAVFKQTP
ncbi:MAG: hypothetical protein ACM3JG_05350 [Thiohalocapsa sp.]